MATNRRFVFLKPDVLSTVSFAYAEVGAPEQEQVKATRVASGRWKNLEGFETTIPAEDVDLRSVSSEEAASGIGTYLGCTICVARTPPASARVWDYGVVVGYSWEEQSLSGILNVIFDPDAVEVIFEEASLEPLELEVYALRPCFHTSVSTVMAREKQAIHKKVSDHFNGRGRNASRNAKTILRAAGRSELDEEQVIPLYDVRTSRVLHVPISYILNHAYYSGGRRRVPRSINLGASVFEGAIEFNSSIAPANSSSEALVEEVQEASAFRQSSGPARETHRRSGPSNGGPVAEQVDNDGILSDSEEDSEPEAHGPGVSAVLPLRRRASEALPSNPSRLHRLRHSLAGDSEMQNELDEFISFRESGLAGGSLSSLRRAGHTSASGDTGAQFRPSALQSTVHDQLVNGTYAGMNGQLLLETVQSESEEFNFLPHPSTLRFAYDWKFGIHGLSTMHFARLDSDSKRACARQYEMSNFSRKYPLPKPARASSISDVVDALDVLTAFSNVLFGSLVQDLLKAARRFLLTPCLHKDLPDQAAVGELVLYVDERFERFRTRIARGDRQAAAAIADEFSVEHTSYTRLVHTVFRRRLSSLAPANATGSFGQKGNARPAKERNVKFSGGTQKRQRTVPLEVLVALPKLNGKALCMRYLSKQGCRGQGATCAFEDRGHFQPAALPQIVRDHIEQHYGGLRTNTDDTSA